MKALSENTSQHFDNHLFEDLQFIRIHKRYPFSRMTLIPLLSLSVLLPLSVRTFLVMLTIKSPNGFHWVNFLILGLILIPFFAIFFRYYMLITFREIKTSHTLSQNIQLLQRFLKEQQLLFTHHPLAPEIFQIISRNITVGDDEQEVLIFIADEKRILINSHFTSSRKKYRLAIQPTHQREMVKLLKDWLGRWSYTDCGDLIVRDSV